jgi:hypothetical protein
MRFAAVLTLGILTGGAIFGSMGLLYAQPPQVQSPPPGRYQIQISYHEKASNTIYLVDTGTAELYALDPSGYWAPTGKGFVGAK